MKVLKKINNNAAICLDSKGTEIVAIGTGIGFPSVPYELTDLSKIQKTYYGINPMYINLMNEIAQPVFDISEEIIDFFKKNVNALISPNIIFSLADHINFAIQRINKGMVIECPIEYDIRQFYEKEYEVGEKALHIIFHKLNIYMPKAEAANIALHFINAEQAINKEISYSVLNEILNETTEIMSKHFNLYIDRKSANYARFIAHLQYMLKRVQTGMHIDSSNCQIYKTVRNSYPDTVSCVQEIKIYLEEKLNFKMDEEEELYLMLHLNKLCKKE
ncbi:PRD domain-containing protein [Holdemania filiformis]|uniref:PRD domain-containing protein n=1 Tax=Holdemania filiformis TaxID=61171 RepID=A0A412FUN4_9FIRM|nr:PRD domain-containing protein [Holdemania filiformis]MBS5001675.1 PRD domain-containing protein [Holdemania filiformis]RGR71871.1 PRD domain-containing protein [Holdemania filiformis]